MAVSHWFSPTLLGYSYLELFVSFRLEPWQILASFHRALGASCFPIPADVVLALVSILPQLFHFLF